MKSSELYESDGWIISGTNRIHETAIIMGDVALGERNIIYPYAVIGAKGFIRGTETIGQVMIGSDNVIGAHASIMAGNKGITVIGNKNLIMNYANIGHNVEIADNNEIGAHSIICGHTTIGNGNRIKSACSIRNRMTIGDYNVLGIGSTLVKHMGTNETWYGNPAVKR